MKYAILIVSLVSLTSCIQPKPLVMMGEAPSFELTSADGQKFDSKSLAGHIWVADFIYTTCDGPCPMMSAYMRRVQDQTGPEIPDVRMVSITVDPDHDTPAALQTYSQKFKCDPSRWFFLTGTKDALTKVGEGFKLQTIDGSLTHSTRFVLVDRHGKVRGYYTTGEDGFMTSLLHDIRQLEADRS